MCIKSGKISSESSYPQYPQKKTAGRRHASVDILPFAVDKKFAKKRRNSAVIHAFAGSADLFIHIIHIVHILGSRYRVFPFSGKCLFPFYRAYAILALLRRDRLRNAWLKEEDTMTPLTIYKDNDADCTVVANLFIDEYMKDANDAQIKIYLYLLRMMNARRATSVSDIADKFNHTEKEVVRALKYWEKAHLLDLDFDEDKTLIGIHIRDLTEADSVRRQRRTAPSTFIPMPSVASEAAPQKEAPAAPAAEQEEAVPYKKKTYTAAQLREFSSRESISQLFFVASQYIGKPLSPAAMNSILFYKDVLHFSDDLIDYLIQYCVDRDKTDFKYIDKVAISWAEQGFSTPAEAERGSHRYEKSYYDIMKQLGRTSSPTPREADYITRWIKEYGYSNDIIFEACARTVLATDKNRFEYADRILRSWHEQKIRHLDDVAKADEQFQQKKHKAAPAKPQSGRFGQFTQNTYDFDALEKELLSN